VLALSTHSPNRLPTLYLHFHRTSEGKIHLQKIDHHEHPTPSTLNLTPQTWATTLTETHWPEKIDQTNNL
jgi:hypothetical protein